MIAFLCIALVVGYYAFVSWLFPKKPIHVDVGSVPLDAERKQLLIDAEPFNE